MKYLFKGGVLDGQGHEIEGSYPTLRVLLKDGKWVEGPKNQVVDESFEIQVYVKNGYTYQFNPELSYK
jgi:hypothetical protein